MTMTLQDIDLGIVRYTQRSIETTFTDRRTSVETSAAAALPYHFSLEVAALEDGHFLSLDNRRLYSAQNYSSHPTVPCVVHQSTDPPTDLMADHGLDQWEVLWVDDQGQLNRLALRANIIEGVMMIQCAAQDSTFPLSGRQDPPRLGPRQFDAQTWKIVPPGLHFTPTADDCMESLQAAARIFVCVRVRFNAFHLRNDLRQILVDRPDIFRVERYERSPPPFTLEARGGKKSGLWDGWDDLLAALAETEFLVHESYEEAFFRELETLDYLQKQTQMTNR
jgi:hypothetical protein